MHFWLNNTASPTIYDTYFSKIGFMRMECPKQPPSIVYDISNNIIGSIYRLTKENIKSVTTFLEYHYGGNDWNITVSDWIISYLSNPSILVLGVISPEDILLGTIFSVPLSNIQSKFDSGLHLRSNSLRIIEGLCIDSSIRGKGIAGHLIASIDYQTHILFGTCIHLWSRELLILPSSYINTALCSATYAYKHCIEIDYPSDLRILSWESFVVLWNIMYDEFDQKGSYIITKLSDTQRRNGITVYITNDNKICVIIDTKRRTHKNEKIYEVVWCGKIIKNKLYPALNEDSYKNIINKISHKISGLLFATSEINGGNATSEWRYEGWYYGTSGYHSWYIYNYIMSSFGSVRLHMIHEEL